MGRVGHTLSTLRPCGRPPGRKNRFRGVARIYRVGSMTHWVPPKGFELFPTSLLLSQAFPGANLLRSETPPLTGAGRCDRRRDPDANSGILLKLAERLTAVLRPGRASVSGAPAG